MDALQDLYGFSSSPLREALNRLSQEGLVLADERRGFRVAEISPEDLADITHMRCLLDVSALRDAIRCGDDAWEAEIVASFHRLDKIESRLQSGPVVLDLDWTARHREFHCALLAACPSERQRSLSVSLFDQAERYRFFAARLRGVDKHKSSEHRVLMNAILNRDAEKASELLNEHILTTQRNFLRAFAKSKVHPVTG